MARRASSARAPSSPLDVRILRRAKLVCTLGPACDSVEGLEALIDAGHGRRPPQLLARHARGARRAARAPARRRPSARSKPVAVLQDLCGPKIRTGTLPAHVRPADRRARSRSSRASRRRDERVIPIQYEGLAADVRVGDRILFDDGRLVAHGARRRGRARAGARRAGRRHARPRRRAPAAQDDAHLGAHREGQGRPRLRPLAAASTTSRCPSSAAPRTCSCPRDLRGVGRADADRREDRDARRRREPREHHRRLRRRDGRARRSRRRVPARARARHPAADPRRRAARAPPGHRRDRDAPVDDQVDAPDARRGERRRERGLRGTDA